METDIRNEINALNGRGDNQSGSGEFSRDIDLRATTREMGLVLDFLSSFRQCTGALIPVNTVGWLTGIKY